MALGSKCPPPKKLEFQWHYKGTPPDEDNIIASCKAYIDGIADAFLANDSHFKMGDVTRIHNKQHQFLIIKIIF